MTISDLKEYLAQKTMTPCDPKELKVALASMLQDDQDMDTLPWHECHLRPLDKTTIGGKPWSILSGEMIVYQDTNQDNEANQILHGLSEEEKERRRKNQRGKKEKRPQERGLKIYT